MTPLKDLTSKEEEIMNFFWNEGPMFVKQLLDKYPDPKPHFNTLSTFVRTLEDKGYLDHEALGTTYRYFPVIEKESFRSNSLKSVINRYFENSGLNAISALIRSEDLSVDEIRKLLDDIDKPNNQTH